MSGGDEAIVERLIARAEPADGVASYYAHYFPGSRLHCHTEGADAAVFVEAQGTHGPVGIIRASHPRLLGPVLAAVPEGKRYVMTTWSLHRALQQATTIDQPARNRVFSLPGGSTLPSAPPPPGVVLRCSPEQVEATSDGVALSKCSLMWCSPHFAELVVETEKEHRRRGLARVVVAAMAAQLLERGISPLYIVSVGNAASLRVAEALGLSPGAEDEFAGTMTLGLRPAGGVP